MLCALVVSAFAAQGASAANTTAFTCVNTGTAFKGAHCLTTGSASQTFSHAEFKEKVGEALNTTAITGTNANTASETTAARPTKLHVTIGGAELELEASGTGGSGTLNNRETGEFWSEGSGTIEYTGVTVLKPAGKGCKVLTDTEAGGKGAEGQVDAFVKATTKGQEDFVKFEPKNAALFASFWVECTAKLGAPLEGTWEITGSVKCPTEGATIVCTGAATTALNTLKAKGNKAGIDGALTLKGPTGTPLTSTTK
jgi:hypothetical protein